MDDKQKEFDFVRDGQRELIRQCVLSPYLCRDGRPVSPRSQKAILMAIDSRAGKDGTCWASVPTLTRDTAMGRRTVLRALEALRALSLIRETPDEKDGRIKHRQIVFSNLEDHRPARPTGATVAPVSASQPVPLARPTGATNARTGATNARTGATSNTQRHLSPHKDNLKAPRGVLEIRPREKGWKLRPGLTVEDLIAPDVVAELWETVIAEGLLPNTGHWRETFFGLCHSIHRNDGKFIDTLRFFHHKLLSPHAEIMQQVADEPDRAWAHDVLRQRDELPRLSLEELFGEELDTLPNDELFALAKQAGPGVWDYLRRNGVTPAIRGALLAALDRQEQVAS